MSVEGDLFFVDQGDINIHNVSIVYERVNRLIIGALVFLMVFSWIDLIQTSIQILFLKNTESNNFISGVSDERDREEEEEVIFAVAYNTGGNNSSTKHTKHTNSKLTETKEIDDQKKMAMENKLTLTSKIVSAFVVTFITIIGIYTLSTPAERSTLR